MPAQIQRAGVQPFTVNPPKATTACACVHASPQTWTAHELRVSRPPPTCDAAAHGHGHELVVAAGDAPPAALHLLGYEAEGRGARGGNGKGEGTGMAYS